MTGVPVTCPMCLEVFLVMEIREGTRLYRMQIDHRVFETGVMHSATFELKPPR